ncbi:MAG: nucleotidyltransferase family protein [Desulfarculus sp.]|nr:nucleotidyltransferase family protein [Desulfarculus sp.]
MALDRLIQERRADILAVAALHGAQRVRVFGSRARGQGGPASDLDLLVDLEPERTLLDLIAIKQDLEDRLACRVDVLTEAALSPYMRQRVIDEAVAL